MKLKYFIFTFIYFLIIFFVCIALVFVVDLHYHNVYLNMAGLNYKGYRGEIVGAKQKNEIRIAFLGGSFAMGYGVRYNEAIPARLQEELQEYCNASGLKYKIKVLNLAYNNEGVYAFYYNLKDFYYLNYDYVILCEGYNDLNSAGRPVGNTLTYRHSNPIFRLSGYMPILPLIIQEKIMLIRGGGTIEEAYRGKKIVFKLKTKDRLTASALESALKAYSNIGTNIDRLNKVEKEGFETVQLNDDKWGWYNYFMKKAIDFALSKNKKVIILSQPYISPTHIEQQDALRKFLQEQYKNEKNLLYINLGEAVSLKDEELSFDGMHLTAKGCKLITHTLATKINDYIFKNKGL